MTDAQAQIVDPMIGVHIDGRYLVQGILGRGGMAIVYEGIHEQLGRSVAIKVLSSGIALDPVLVERFLREARMASGLSHSNIVEVWDLGRLPDGRPYLIMPKLAGVDFASFLERNGPQSPARVVELLSGVALALDFVHAKGLLHRDVKLENLMHIVREDGSEHVMLMDFGIATAAANPASARLTDYGVVCGTPAYLPPEVAVGAVSDRRADVYALATVAFELMTGRLPFQTDDPLRMLPLKATRDAPRMSEVTGHQFPEAIEQVVAQGLAFRPEERFSRAGEFVASLEDAVLQSAEELGLEGRELDRRSRQVFGRGSLHSALYRIPERESPRSLAPSERVTDTAPPRRKSATPRDRGPGARAPRRRGEPLGTLGWLGCLALAALLGSLIWTAGRSGSRQSASNKEPTAPRESEQVWQIRPNPETGSGAPSTLESATESQNDESAAPGTLPVAVATGHGASPEPEPQGALTDPSATAAASVTRRGAQGSPSVTPQVRSTLQPVAPQPPPPLVVPQAGTTKRPNPTSQPPSTSASLPPAPQGAPGASLPPAPTQGAPSEPVTSAVAEPPAPVAAEPEAPAPLIAQAPAPPVELPPTPVAASTPAAQPEVAVSPRAPAPATHSDTPKGGRLYVEPLPLPVEPQPRAQLSRVPAPPPLRPLGDRDAAGDAPAAPPPSVTKLNEEASAAMLAGHLARAAGLYQQATRTDSQNVGAWRGLALTSERLGRNQEAIQAYTRALELSPLGAQAETLRNRLKALQSHP